MRCQANPGVHQHDLQDDTSCSGIGKIDQMNKISCMDIVERDIILCFKHSAYQRISDESNFENIPGLYERVTKCVQRADSSDTHLGPDVSVSPVLRL